MTPFRHPLAAALLALCPALALSQEPAQAPAETEAAPATIYRHATPGGGTEFSDRPAPGAVPVQLPRANTTPGTPLPSAPPQPAAPAAAEEFQGYRSLSIQSPTRDGVYNDGSGRVPVSLALQPPLQPGHGLRLTLDGRRIELGAALGTALDNLDRGEHRLEAAVLDETGAVLKRAKPVLFHVMRPSVAGKH